MKQSVHAKTEHLFGSITYSVISLSSEHVTDTLKKKIEKLIFKEIQKDAET